MELEEFKELFLTRREEELDDLLMGIQVTVCDDGEVSILTCDVAPVGESDFKPLIAGALLSKEDVQELYDFLGGIVNA